eukprot:1388142-Amphidinium_carterae.1
MQPDILSSGSLDHSCCKWTIECNVEDVSVNLEAAQRLCTACSNEVSMTLQRTSAHIPEVTARSNNRERGAWSLHLRKDSSIKIASIKTLNAQEGRFEHGKNVYLERWERFASKRLAYVVDPSNEKHDLDNVRAEGKPLRIASHHEHNSTRLLAVCLVNTLRAHPHSAVVYATQAHHFFARLGKLWCTSFKPTRRELERLIADYWRHNR